MQAFHANAIGPGVLLSTTDPLCVLYLFKNQFKKVFLLLSSRKITDIAKNCNTLQKDIIQLILFSFCLI